MEKVCNHYLLFAIIVSIILVSTLLLFELLRAQTRFKAICDNSGNMVVIGRAIKDKTGKIVDVEIINCNQVYAQHLNKNVVQVRGMRFVRDFYAGSAPEWFKVVQESITMHDSRHLEFEYPPLRTRYVGSIFCLSAIRGRCCLIMAENSAEYNRQQELERSRCFIDSVLSLSGVGFWRWDFEAQEFTIIKSVFHGAAENSLQVLPTDEIIAQIHPDDSLLFVRFMASGQPMNSMVESTVFRLRNPTGEWHWVQTVSVKIEYDSNNVPLCMDGVLLDIDSLKRAQLKAEEMLREIAVKQQQLLQTMRQCQTGFCSWHIGTDRVFFDNNFWAVVGGVPLDSGVCIPETMTLFQKLVLPDDPGAVAHWIAQMRGGSSTEEECSFRCQMTFLPDEWWEVRNFVAERDKDGRPLVISAFVINVSKLKQNELVLETAMLEANAVSQAKSRFLGIMSHEIRTPLNAIIGFSTMIKNKDSLPQIHSYADLIQRSGEMLMVLINDLLEMVKKESLSLSLHLVPLNLYGMLCGLREMFALKASSKGLYLNLECPQTPELFHLDAKRLNQVLVNLIGNAVKFTDTGGITLLVKITPREARGSAGGCTKLCRLSIAVKDTGVGIAEEDFDCIFEPFEQAANGNRDKDSEGSGLGLAICHNLVGLMGGTITVESKVGEGSNFIVLLETVEMIQVAAAEEALAGARCLSDHQLQTLDICDFNDIEREHSVELATRFESSFRTMHLGMHVQSAHLLVEQLKQWLEQRDAPGLRLMVDLLAKAVADFDVSEVQRICSFLMKQGGNDGT
ncbi:MAG: ATP-binding protein [Kiritimatiellae bacterium]|nr:ATP-binding protein [Kiritimatiellia bacterium]